MAGGSEIIKYKNRILKDIIHNKDETLSTSLIEAIDPSFIGDEDSIVYENIFPYLRVPDTVDETKALITMSVDMPRVSTKNYFFKDMVITINVLVHQDYMKMPTTYSATRVDYIASIINKMFNQNPNYGNRPLEYVSDVESIVLDKFFMRSMRFRCNELNNVRC